VSVEPGARAGTDPEFGAASRLDDAMADLLARGAVELPLYPAVALRLADLVRGGDFGLDELARLASSDQALATDLLRAANSAYHRRGGVIASIPQAVARLGADELARIALASGLGAVANARGPLAALRRRAWHDALASALLCRELARARGVAREDAFTCGLLHDFGRIIAISALERISGGSRPGAPMPRRFWEAVVDRYHVGIGATLAARWELPRVVAEAIALHHADSPRDATAPELVAVVRAVDPVVGLLGERASLGIDDAASIARLSEADVDALERALQLLPGFVAAFEREPGPPDRTLLEPPRPASALEPPPPGVRLDVAGRTYDVTGLAPHQLLVRGPAPLPEGLLLEVEPRHPAGAAFHARVLLCWPEGEGFGAALAPFALTGPALLHWNALVPAGAAS
jgi:putative nucleotidyltransferase with HDIG domain